MRISLTILLLGLLATPLVIKRIAAHNKPAVSTGGALSRYGFSFQEVSKAAGIDFRHTSPHLDAKLAHIMPQVASMGAAVSIVDFDRDGWPDIYVTNGGEEATTRFIGTSMTAHFATSRERSDWPMSISQALVRPWARCGATTTTTATKMS